MTVGLVTLWVALSPSLLPRAWWMTAVNVGVSIAYGYVVGSLLGHFVSWLARRTDLRVEVNARSDWGLRTAWLAILVIVSGIVWIRSLHQQEQISLVVGVNRGGAFNQFIGVLAGVALLWLLVLMGRGLRRLWRHVKRLVEPVLPAPLEGLVATVILLVVLLFVSETVVYQRALNWALGNATQLSQTSPEGRTAPPEPQRSGSPASYETWESLGREGQMFVSDGPRASDIEAVTGESAMEPIRVYAGKAEHDVVEDAARAAAAELVRAGGLDRSIVNVSTTTGTGFVQEWSVQALEFLTGGDVATVSMQYSYFPSGLAYISDRDTPPRAGRALFEAVEAEIQALPEAQRPRLFASGESLGSFGGQGAFENAQDMLSRVDGAMWTGTPRFTPLWSSLTESRREGSPEIAPVIDNGRHIRFATRPLELTEDLYGAPFVNWEEPRIVYGQHASDPVVWWSWDLLWQEPDWLREQVGRDVSPDLSWERWVTFWQIASDMPLSVDVAPGHGHEYTDEMVPLWAGVLGMDPVADYSEIIAAIDALVLER
ncbi:alpha/beta hydrolase [Ornithinimicrobium murale]|uniref:alpha/beta hydrolase n=1 Tax=Ornithinimicrobium murale TaxID=1050153 RepID=UPI0013B4423A|nr:alpha/beta-hydrolase family protein [Ornithinimicrobium murale]